MKLRQTRSLGSQTNDAVERMTSKVDGRTSEVAHRAAGVIALAVRVLRIPTAVLGLGSLPFILLTLLLGASADGALRMVVLAAGTLMAGVSAAFWGRRHKIIWAVQDTERLATELGIMISLSDKVDETRGALAQISGRGGWRLFDRLNGLWKGAAMTGRWIEGIGDLPRARYFGPPKIGTTVSVAFAALWLVPVSIVVALLALIGSIAAGF